MAKEQKATEQFSAIEEFKPNLTMWMAKQNLKLALPVDAVKTKKQYGIDLEYVNPTILEDILDTRVGVWDVETTGMYQVGQSVTVSVRLKIHCTDGIISYDGIGMEPLASKAFEDPLTIAYNKAFFKACKSAGLGRDLARKQEHELPYFRPAGQESNHVTQQQLPMTQGQVSAKVNEPVTTGRVQSQQPNQAAAPQSDQGNRPQIPASIKQKNFIKSLLGEGANEELACLAKFKVAFDDLTSSMASSWIKELNESKN